jgi:hypothetical protein
MVQLALRPADEQCVWPVASPFLKLRTIAPVFFRHAVEITKLVEYASNAPGKNIENTGKREVKNAVSQFRSFLGKVMQTNGGVLGTVGSITTTGLPAGVAAQFGMAKPPGVQLFSYNQTVEDYDPTLTTNRSSPNVLLVDPSIR